MGVKKVLGLLCPIPTGKLRGHAEGVKGMNVATRRQNIWGSDKIPTRDWRCITTRQSIQQCRNFAVF